MYFFTSITSNYIPKARILARSVKKYCPNSIFYLVLCDEIPPLINIQNEPFDSILLIKDLDLPINNLQQWIFIHSAIELCTAVKAQAFLKIFENETAEKIVYLDPDIVVFNDLDEVSKLLDENSIIVTPHLTEPENTIEAIMDNEICSLKHGIFNLGFLAIKRNVEGLRFVKWWRDRLIYFCFDDIPNGLFTDQKWIDIAMAFFKDLYILRDNTYNVAPWNISTRNMHIDINGKLFINDSPVKFFHFSGFDSHAIEYMIKKYAYKNKNIFDLKEWYTEELKREGQEELGGRVSIFDFFSNDEKIAYDHRKIYRTRKDLNEYFHTPYIVRSDKLCYLSWYNNEFKNIKPSS